MKKLAVVISTLLVSSIVFAGGGVGSGGTGKPKGGSVGVGGTGKPKVVPVEQYH